MSSLKSKLIKKGIKTKNLAYITQGFCGDKGILSTHSQKHHLAINQYYTFLDTVLLSIILRRFCGAFRYLLFRLSDCYKNSLYSLRSSDPRSDNTSVAKRRRLILLHFSGYYIPSLYP